MDEYLEWLVDEKLKASTQEEKLSYRFRLMDSILVRKPLTHEKHYAEMILFLIKYVELAGLIQTEIAAFQSKFPKTRYLDTIEKEWEKKKARLFKVPVFELKDTSGQTRSLGEFRGKIVYIDFWGSWCKPCLEQMPNVEKLQNSFAGKDIIFLFIDFYDSHEKWISTLRGKKLKGVHLKEDAANESYFDLAFGIGKGFPRYALIDREGRMVSSAAPHPNDPTIVEYLNKYLEQ